MVPLRGDLKRFAPPIPQLLTPHSSLLTPNLKNLHQIGA